MNTPCSKIAIYNVPLNNRYEHTFYFDNGADMVEFYDTYLVREYNQQMHIRHNQSLKLEASFVDAEKWTYAIVGNRSVPDARMERIYFYFITNVRYISETVVEIDMEMDVLQTYFVNGWKLLPSFIERTHTKTDAIGEHTLDESLDCGELVSARSYMVDTGELGIFMLSTVYLNDDVTDAAGAYAVTGSASDNVFCGLKTYACALSRYTELIDILETYTSIGKIDGIISMWMYPLNMCRHAGGDWLEGDAIKEVFDASGPALTVSDPSELTTMFEGYEPKNNKVWCYPFRLMYVHNNAGSGAIFRYERMNKYKDEDGNYQFALCGTVSPAGSVRMHPYMYNGEMGWDYGVELPNFPQCAWNTDSYQLWLAQNYNSLRADSANAAVSVGVGAVSAIAGIATGRIGGAAGGVVGALGGLMQINQQVAQKKDMQVQPAQSRGAHSVSINMSNGYQTFQVVDKCLTAEHAKMVDDYFQMYGYRVSCIDEISLCNRKYWTFVKTVGCRVDGDFPQDAKAKIAQIFDSGVTWWRPYKDNSGVWHIPDYSMTNETL